VPVTVELTNEGDRDGHEVAQLYVGPPVESSPARHLAGFERVWIPAHATKTVTFALTPWQLSTVGEEGDRAVQPGRYRLSVGGRQPDTRSALLTGTAVLETTLDITGPAFPLPA
jgi:beta-glucosidase